MTRDRTEMLADLLRRDAAGQELSGNEIARRSGLAQTYVAKILRGESDPPVSVLLKLLAVLGRVVPAHFAATARTVSGSTCTPST